MSAAPTLSGPKCLSERLSLSVSLGVGLGLGLSLSESLSLNMSLRAAWASAGLGPKGVTQRHHRAFCEE